jgi:hypothetical protein
LNEKVNVLEQQMKEVLSKLGNIYDISWLLRLYLCRNFCGIE